MPSDELTLADLFAIVWADKARIALWIVAAAIIGVAYTFVMPARWQAKSSLILPIPDDSSGGGSGGAALAAIVGQNNVNPLDILEGVMSSHDALTSVANRTGIEPEKIDDMLKAKGDPSSNQLVITAESESQNKSIEIAKAAIDELGKLTASLGISVASRQAVEIKKTLAEKEAQLKVAENKLTQFQSHAKTFPDPTQPYSAATYQKAYSDSFFELNKVNRQLSSAKTLAKGISELGAELPTGLPDIQPLRDKLIDKQTQLDLARVAFKETAPEVQELKKEVAVLKGSLKGEVVKKLQAANTNIDATVAQLEAQRIVLRWQTDYLKTLAGLAPSEAAQTMRLVREIQLVTGVVQDLRVQYEKAKVQESTDKVRWSVLDEPYIVLPAMNKHFGRSAAFGGGVGFFIGAFIAYWRRTVKLRAVTI